MRTFNTAGPVRAERHYQIAPLSRIDLDEVLGLIRDERYFVLHAPRQTGKTSALLALERTIAEGIEQTRTYIDRCAAEAGHLVVFDRSPERSWEQKVFRRTAHGGAGSPVTVWGT